MGIMPAGLAGAVFVRRYLQVKGKDQSSVRQKKL
jgi:hypothetical protein